MADINLLAEENPEQGIVGVTSVNLDYVADPTGLVTFQVVEDYINSLELGAGNLVGDSTTITLLASGWNKTIFPYTQEVSIPALKTNSMHLETISKDRTDTQLEQYQSLNPECYCDADGVLTFRCNGIPNTVDIGIVVQMIGTATV